MGAAVRFRGRGIGRSLVLFSLVTSLRLSKDLGCFCVLTHPIDDGVRDFHRVFGFRDLPLDPGRAMAVRIADMERSGF